MPTKKPTYKQLLAENAELRRLLEQARQLQKITDEMAPSGRNIQAAAS